MRISDWSSDVCSSDLVLSSIRRGVGNGNRIVRVGRRSLQERGRRCAVVPGLDLLASPRPLSQRVRHQGRNAAWSAPGLVLSIPDLHCCRSAWRMYARERSEEHTSELQSLMRISYAVVCFKKKT